MKVLQLISSSGYYGAEAVVVNLSRGLTALGTASTVGVFQNSGSLNPEVADVATQKGLSVELISCRGRADWSTVRGIADLARRVKVDCIHTHGYKAHVYGYLASKSHSTPLVSTCHGYYSRFTGKGRSRLADLRQRLYTTVDLVMLRRSDQVVATSEMLAKSLLSAGIAQEKLTVIGNGIELEAFSCASPSADLGRLKRQGLAIGLVARLIEGKGHSDLLQASKGILAEYPDTLVFLIGEGPLRGPLEALARELGIDRSVIFVGKRRDMANVYAALDMVVLPSLFEGMPMVILEALAARKPVIATRVGAVPDVIRDGGTGLLIEPGDPVELQRAIKRLIEDAGLRRSLAENGHERVKAHFSAASMAGNYQRVYESALRG
jgi:glycosyltransferase involved in cell wall biosynthesis